MASKEGDLSTARSAEQRLKQKLEDRSKSPERESASAERELTPNEETLDPYGFIRDKEFDQAAYDEFSTLYVPVLTRRGVRWRGIGASLSHIPRRSRKMKRFIRKGVPSSLRQGVWLSVSGADRLLAASPTLYGELSNSSSLDQKVLDSIDLDLHRTLTDNVYFRSSLHHHNSKLPALRNILVAVARHRPAIGYCQGLNFIVASLLLVVDSEEEAFWLMVSLLDLVPDYYGAKLGGLRRDCYVLQQLVRQKLPRLHDQLTKHECSIDLFATRWFINLFLDCLPTETALRVLDCLFYEGSKVLFRVALTMLAHEEERLLACSDIGDILMFMKTILEQKWTLYCHEFMRMIFEVPQPLSRKTIDRLREQAATDQSL